MNGRIVLDATVKLPEGADVEVSISEVERPEVRDTHDAPPSLYERLKPVVGALTDLPPDLATNHDHYLHGCPKRS